MYGARIKELRETKQLTQTELAKQINSTQKQISKWETEFLEPNIFWLCKLAKFFDVSIDYIVGIENDNSVFEFTYEHADTKLTHKERKQ